MEQKVPNHHIKQKICANRPAYREGRNLKAVKVYTVNNESKYVLIQGVPSVGATRELIELCSSFGEIEEHHTLDEYPCEDKYTEVYLVKFKKIQSARFAKRKLDDHSFFGGCLHVCYAPEYETVQETRDKLQERRKTIAAKIRQHKKEQVQDSSITKDYPEGKSASPTQQITRERDHLKLGDLPSPSNDSHVHTESTSTLDLHLLSPQAESSDSLPESRSISSSCTNSTHPFTFVLPSPPRPSLKTVPSGSKYEYSRVPSKHSTLPLGFDGRLDVDIQRLESHAKPKVQKTEATTSKETPILVDKNYKPAKKPLKFIPRQAVKRTLNESGDNSKIQATDEVDKEIRKNAFVLTDEQGPADLPGRRVDVPEITPGASGSYNQTIKTIRSKITKVITDAMKPPN